MNSWVLFREMEHFPDSKRRLEQYIVEDLFDLDPYTPDSAIPSNDFNATDHSFQPRSTESLFVQHPLAQTNHFYSTLGPLPDLPLALDPGLLTSAPTLDPAQLHAPAHSPVPGPSRHRAVASTTHSIPSSSLSSLDSTPASTSSTKIPPSRTVSAPGVASKEDEAVSLWERSLAHLKEHLTPKRFTVAPSATYRAISDVLDTFTITSTNKRQSNWGDLSDVPPEGRFSILTTMLASARGEFWSAWLELENKSKTPSKGLDVIEKWLLGAVSTKATTLGTIENQLANTLLPLLQVSYSPLSLLTLACRNIVAKTRNDLKMSNKEISSIRTERFYLVVVRIEINAFPERFPSRLRAAR